jgi:hypothetical protein
MSRRVKILTGMSEFIGQTGSVVGKEGHLLRVALDTPVEIEGLGSVADDLWEPRCLRTIRAKVSF